MRVGEVERDAIPMREETRESLKRAFADFAARSKEYQSKVRNAALEAKRISLMGDGAALTSLLLQYVPVPPERLPPLIASDEERTTALIELLI